MSQSGTPYFEIAGKHAGFLPSRSESFCHMMYVVFYSVLTPKTPIFPA
jgi:hypothetical protein